MCVFLKPRANTISFVPCRFRVFLPSCLLQESRGQTWRPRARTNQSVPSRFSQSLVCFFFKPRATRSHLYHVGSVCSSHLVCSTYLDEKRGALEQERPTLCHVGSVKVLCLFFLTPEQASKIPSVPCSFSLFLPPFLGHTSRGQTWIPRASTNQPLPC